MALGTFAEEKAKMKTKTEDDDDGRGMGLGCVWEKEERREGGEVEGWDDTLTGRGGRWRRFGGDI